MKAKIRHMCSFCGKTFHDGLTEGLPNGVCYVKEDGTMINQCQECIIKVGMMTEEEKKKYFEKHNL